MKIEVTDLRNDRDDSFVATQLSTYNATFTVRDFRLLRVFARNADGSIIGGLLADMAQPTGTHGSCSGTLRLATRRTSTV
ncbi:hypothetical protein R69658_02182 [Paraburkholderia aspalathi]|uniref:Uncharacterized protein n=1 Tax=Paraburkholderia aspalathi TaxID=1324617 RepID=A0ABM8R8R7_9BURK|nr:MULTISPECIES: hypothetical protein [Paraburkholderia]MBK3818973.1 hypothetical protein [Paraburkholderia aspalathi]MBK3830759.1 hypothetical protein [Paraburkholderia aspalathi]MBK3843586.1 hypothetical protein [Paraburkholderia aspalathi]MBK3860528.1 hypothetical protein [Paraburkholderia aspalathi]MCX4138528.1 hypothetical protein [Paraburkholderia aspalathi]